MMWLAGDKGMTSQFLRPESILGLASPEDLVSLRLQEDSFLRRIPLINRCNRRIYSLYAPDHMQQVKQQFIIRIIQCFIDEVMD